MTPLNWICRKLKNTVGRRLYSLYKRGEIGAIGSGFRTEYPLHVSGGKHIRIGRKFRCHRRNRLEAWSSNGEPTLEIGDNVYLTWDIHIGAIHKIVIGNNVLIGSRVLITDHMHGSIDATAIGVPPVLRPLYSKGAIVIGDNVWIGEGAAILHNVTIGENTIIGANAVVTRDLPANCVAAGNPARIIRYL